MHIDKGWCLQMAKQEGDAEIGAGLLARDPWVCTTCHGSGYVQAPADDAWRQYFIRVGQTGYRVLVDCPSCKSK